LRVTYWLGKKHWGKGVATQALKKLLQEITDRPIFARAAKDNIGSIRVLQKCDFKIIGENKDFARGRGEETEESISVYMAKPMIKIPNQAMQLTASRHCNLLFINSDYPAAMRVLVRGSSSWSS